MEVSQESVVKSLLVRGKYFYFYTDQTKVPISCKRERKK